MTEIAVRPEDRPIDYWPTPQPQPAPSEDPTGGRLVAWANGLAAAHKIGSALCQTSFAPKQFAGKAEDAAAAILFGDEIGLTPTQALRSIHVIAGTPSLYARAMVALVQSKGHEVWTELDTPAKVVVCGKRRGTTHVERSEWTTDRARRAGYTSNKKYETDPQAMLYARAASDVCRKIAADALAGLAYTVEELEIGEQPTTTVTRSEPAGPRKVSREKPQPAEPDPVPEPPTAEESAEESATRAQVQKLNILIQEQGITERQAKLDYLSTQVGRTLTSSNDLSKHEASSLIELLDATKPAEPTLPEPEGWQQ